MSGLDFWFRENIQPILREHWYFLVIILAIVMVVSVFFRSKSIARPQDYASSPYNFLYLMYRHFGQKGYRIAVYITAGMMVLGASLLKFA